MFDSFKNKVDVCQSGNTVIYCDSFIYYYLAIKRNKLDLYIFLWKYVHDIQLKDKKARCRKIYSTSIYVKQIEQRVLYAPCVFVCMCI